MLEPSDPALFEKQLLGKLGLKPSDGSISTQIVEPEYVADLAYSAISCFSVLANLADDIRHLHRTEIAEVHQIYEVHDVGSSTMPHKINPRNFEHVKSMWKAMMPRMITVFMDQISEHQRDLTNSASGRFLIELFVAFDYSVSRLISAFNEISVDEARMRRNLETSKDQIIAEPLYILLAMNGVSEAYYRARDLFAESDTTKIPLTELIWKKPDIRSILDRLNSAQLEVLRDPAKYVGASKQRALTVVAQAEETIETILFPYTRGQTNDASLARFRSERRPSYQNMEAAEQELMAAGHSGLHE